MSQDIERYKAKLKIADEKIFILENMIENRTRQLYTSNLELKQQNKELAQFAYITSHDLQEPLRTINSFVGLVRDGYADKLDEDGAEYLEYISEAAVRMSLMIKSLLEHSRIGHQWVLTSVDCNDMLESIQKDLASSIAEVGAEFDIGKLPQLTGSTTELRMLFQNLISNAIKFRMNDNVPKISISADKEPGFWKFSLRDNGIGIQDEFKEEIFTIFRRLHARDRYEGAGIGLAHCQKIVNLHGGKIWVDSQPGKGSTFYFTIPS